MSAVKTTHGAWVLVADGRKALLLKNEGDAEYPNLKVQRVLAAPENPPTREQGADSPGRAIMGGRRSAMEQTDWHGSAERAFAEQVASVLQALHRKEDMKALVLVAPPRALANLRQAIPEELRQVIVAEIDKDLTKQPVHEIERHLA